MLRVEHDFRVGLSLRMSAHASSCSTVSHDFLCNLLQQVFQSRIQNGKISFSLSLNLFGNNNNNHITRLKLRYIKNRFRVYIFKYNSKYV